MAIGVKIKMRKILAVASAGGHWIQLLRLRPAFQGNELRFVTTNKDFRSDVEQELYVVTDASLWEKLKLIKMFVEMLFIMLRYRPDVVITTGAAPGFSAIFWGKLFRAKTIWIDSIANAEELSGSGKKARIFADVWLTQWEHLSNQNSPGFNGKVV